MQLQLSPVQAATAAATELLIAAEAAAVTLLQCSTAIAKAGRRQAIKDRLATLGAHTVRWCSSS